MDFKKPLAKAVMSGLVASLATSYLLGETNDVTLLGMTMNAPCTAGLTVGAGSLVADYSSDAIAGVLGLDLAASNTEHLILPPVVCGAATAGILILGGAVDYDRLFPTLLLGAGSKLAGDYVEYKVFDMEAGIWPMF